MISKRRSKATWILTGVLTLCVIFGASFLGVYPIAAATDTTIKTPSQAIVPTPSTLTPDDTPKTSPQYADQISSKNVTWIVHEEIEDVAAHEIVKQDHFEGMHEGEQEALTAFGITPGQYAVSDVMYDMNEKNSFEYTISWSPMGQYIRIGLLSENKKDFYFVRCISGKDEGAIDMAQIPTGKYFLAVYNETSDHLDLEELNGNITYCFQ